MTVACTRVFTLGMDKRPGPWSGLRSLRKLRVEDAGDTSIYSDGRS